MTASQYQEVQKAVTQVRPPLSLVAPLSAGICWGYVMVNIILGFGMIFIYEGSIAPISIAAVLSYPAWGALFLLAASITTYGLVTNNWKLTRKSQLFGLTLKAIWAFALIIRCFEYPQTILITGVWIFFAYIQVLLYIHFLPVPRGIKNEQSTTN